MEIRIIESKEIQTIIPLLKILNKDMSEKLILERVADMVAQGYKCAGAFDGENLVAICGIWIITKVYVGRHVEPDNVIVHPDYKSTGVGRMLIEWVLAYGQQNGCIASELNCYISNEPGQKFWEHIGYKAIGYHYQKPLKS